MNLVEPAYCVSLTIAGTPHRVVVDVQTQAVTVWAFNGSCWETRPGTHDEHQAAQQWLADNRSTWSTWLPLIMQEAHG